MSVGVKLIFVSEGSLYGAFFFLNFDLFDYAKFPKISCFARSMLHFFVTPYY
jgi:hypothetical protein